MKKIITLSLFLGMSAISLNSCSPSKSVTGSSSVENQLISKVGTSLISSLGAVPALSNIASKITMASKLSTLLNSSSLVSAFQSVVSSKFQIPLTKVSNAYSTFKTLKDVAGFVGKNASSSVLSGL